ncbi:MAG: hypothetical protein J6T26_01975, partial [Firmicutes bacterium]|nr:hypothetical protein [Bacillota bacterium]
YPLVCIITEDVSKETLNILNAANIQTIRFEKIKTPENIMQHNLKVDEARALVWKDVLTKFQIFNLEKYDKIIFLDADLLILKNVDHCFDMPHMTAALDGEKIEDCVAIAAAEGACCVTSYDALGGLKPIGEIKARIAAGWETL